MSKDPYKDWAADDAHPSEAELFLYLDGELGTKEAGVVRAHLEACWSCRVRTEKVQEAISSFIDYRNQFLTSLIEQPPHGWRKFDGKLSQLAAESGKRSLVSQVLGSLGRLFPAQRLSLNPQLLRRVALSFLIAAVIAGLVIRSNREASVSASEFLKKATEAEAAQIHATAQPVIYQRLQVLRKDQASSREIAADWEIWHDTMNSRIRQSVTDASGRRFIPTVVERVTAETDRSENRSDIAVLVELEQVLSANHMDPRQPLSPASYQAWRNSLGQKHEEVIRSRLASGLEALTLRTLPASQVSVGRIVEAVMVVRAHDWQPFEQRLRVRAEQGDRIYELTQTAFEVVSLTAISPEIFSDDQVAALPTPNVIATVTPPSPSVSLHPAPLRVAPAPIVATADLEVEVLRLLHQARADLGEQVGTARAEDGLLRVTGIVETEQRKSEILRALQPVMNHQAVSVEIQTVAEALAQRRQAGADPPLMTEQRIEINSDSVAAAPELRRHFDNDAQIRQFAARMVNRSRQAMRHAYALKRLLGQFSLEDLRTLSPEARAKWLGLIRAHAHAYQQETETLRRELRPIFSPVEPSIPTGGVPEITDEAGLRRGIEQLFSLASATDRVIRSAFAASNESAMMTGIKTPQFWQSLGSAEAFAARIQSVK
jgi:anti-sigma factor RsiW